MYHKISSAFIQTVNNFRKMLPILFGVFMLVNLLNPFLQKYYSKIFTDSYLYDPLIGAAAGSISFGTPVTSYIISGELLERGVSLIAVTAFILAWTTVGIVMLPLEISYLGKKFAISRNVINFVFSILISVLAVIILNLI